jgi:hypothetical protein
MIIENACDVPAGISIIYVESARSSLCILIIRPYNPGFEQGLAVG